MIGERIGNYRLVRELGKGGMGVVYEALNEQIAHRAAIKVLHPRFSEDREVAGRFFNEARAVNIIRHPGIVSVSEFGHLPGPGGAAYIVMEYLEGESLRARLRRGIGEAETLRLARQIASALSAAHQKHIVHRDLKPDNVMLVPDPDMPGGERVKVLDFGIAKLAEEHKNPEVTELSTATGVAIGTPIYMSPEQCRGAGAVDDRSDVYSLGVMLYQMLSGKPPFVGAGAGAVMGMHMYEAPRPLPERVNPALAALVQEMLAKEPDRRPAMTEVAARLEALSRDRTGVAALPPAAADAGDSLPFVSTLGQAAGQSDVLPPAGPRPRRYLTALAAALCLVLGVGLGLLTLPTRRPAPAPLAAAPDLGVPDPDAAFDLRAPMQQNARHHVPQPASDEPHRRRTTPKAPRIEGTEREITNDQLKLVD